MDTFSNSTIHAGHSPRKLVSEFCITLPEWAKSYSESIQHQILDSPEKRAKVAIELSKLNVEHDTGGPFGTVITDLKGAILGIGVNRVVPGVSSMLHGEIVALFMAQANVQSFTLHQHQAILTTNAEPCVMCWGALNWPGLSKLEYCATSSHVETLTTFDEGPKPLDWKTTMKGVQVEHLKEYEDNACLVLTSYAKKNGVIYNRDTI